MSYVYNLCHATLIKRRVRRNPRFLTSFNADDRSSESQRDGEALPDVDHSVKQPILCVGIWDHTLLLLQGLRGGGRRQTQTVLHLLLFVPVNCMPTPTAHPVLTLKRR